MTELKNLEAEADFSKVLDRVLTEAWISPYRLAAIASDLVGREVRPQMTYSYCKSGMIKSSLSTTGKIQVSRVDARNWLTKYVPKHRIG